MSGSIGQLQTLISGAQQAPHPDIATLNRLYPQPVAATPAAPAYDEEKGYTDQYNTKLTPAEEAAYQAWGQQQAATRQDKRNPAQDTYDYDMRGFWKAGGGAPSFADNGHAGDAYKKPNHPTFSSLSQYSTPAMPGGQWAKLPDGSWTFAPSAHNLQMNDAGDLQQYFAKQEQGNKLILPPAQPAASQAPILPGASADSKKTPNANADGKKTAGAP